MKKYIVIFIIVSFIFISKIDAYLSFKVGNLVTYKGIDFYVIKDSSNEKDSVLLLKRDFLSAEEIQKYSAGTGAQTNNYGGVQYGLTTDYETSYVKSIVDAWVSDNIDSNHLNEARILSYDDLTDNLGYEKKNEGTINPSSGGITPSFITDTMYNSWTMTPYNDSVQLVWHINGNGVVNNRDINSNFIGVRPVIDIKKENIDDYDRIVEYNKVKYYIINDDKNNDRITLLKATPITSDEIKDYLSSTEIANKVRTYNEYVSMAYYSNDTCVSAGNQSGCSTDYEVSNVKQVVDIWSKHYTKDEDLVEARLLNSEDLTDNLGYDWNITSEGAGVYPIVNDNVPIWGYNRSYQYWTMSQTNDSSKVWYISNNGTLFNGITDDNNSIRPVIVLKRSAIYNDSNDEIKEDESTSNYVKVANTYSKKALIIIIIGFIMVLVGLFTFYKIQNVIKERK